MKISIGILATILFSLAACSPPVNRMKEGYTESYVIEYYSSSGIELSWRSESYIAVSIVPDGQTYGALSTDEAEIALYKAKCEAHNDFGYDRAFYYGPDTPNRFQDKDFSNIDIISDADWDDAHPA